jgi:hypothetical protein
MTISHMSPAARAARRRKPPEATVEAEPEPAPRTHNLPQPSLMLDADGWHEWLSHVFEGALARRAQFEGPFQRFVEGFPLKANPLPGEPPIGIEKWNTDTAAKAVDMLKKLVALIDTASDLHKAEKKPVLVAVEAIDGFRKAFMAPLEARGTVGTQKNALLPGASAMRNVLTDRLKVWEKELENRVRRENEKLAAEAAARARALTEQATATNDPTELQQAAEASALAEHAAQQATAPARELGRVHGTMGGNVSRRDNWTWEPADLMVLVKAVTAGTERLEYLTFNGTAITHAVKSLKVREIAGVRVFNNETIR